MKTDSWVLVESFFLPLCRHRLPQIYEYLDKEAWMEAAKIVRAQKQYVERLILNDPPRRLNPDYKELLNFLVWHRKALSNRCRTIRLRAKEL